MKNWEEQFEICWKTYGITYEQIKDFIRSLLWEQLQETEKIVESSDEKIKTKVAQLAGITANEIYDTGQSVVAGQKLGDILEALSELRAKLTQKEQELV